MSVPVLPDADLTRFIRLAGMLGSDHAGERAVAALKATELLKAHRLTWAEVLGRLREPPDQPPIESRWRLLRRECLARPDLLTEWELAFLARIGRQGGISARQLEVLEQITAKVRGAGR